MSRTFSWTAFILSVASLLAATALPTQTSAGPFDSFLSKKPTTSVEKLADLIDDLEEDLDGYGTVVAKQPDFWGESRLLRHRDEFEQQMADELSNFTGTINAQVDASDQAFLATATLIEAAINGSTATSNSNLSTFIGSVTEESTTTGIINDATKVERSKVAGKPDFSKFRVRDKDGKPKEEDITTLEPIHYLNQKARYLNHLHELRRVNEGDDTTDSPGYSLDLMRVPVSILPGKKTRTGYGAEITFTATPVLGDKILETTFRRWVINDLIHFLTIPLTKILNDHELRGTKEIINDVQEVIDLMDASDLPWHDSRWYTDKSLDAPGEPGIQPLPPAGAPRPTFDQTLKNEFQRQKLRAIRERFVDNGSKKRVRDNGIKTTIDTGIARNRNGQLPFPFSQFSTVYGQGLLLRFSWEAFERIGRGKPLVHFQDVEGFVKDELTGAYELMLANPVLWKHCGPSLCDAVRTRNIVKISDLRKKFFDDIGTQVDGAGNSTTGACAWAIVVEASLLNERLIQDMKETAANKRCRCLPTDWMPFYLPNAPKHVNDIFAEYVACRWPVYVFALDPITQDQNVGSSFSRRRELQLALAIGLSTGQVRADNITRFARRLEMDMETIGLNRTIVSFSHGTNTFGWRFYPRVQVPPVETNFKVGFRDLLIGGPTREDDLANRQLKPGQRECTALVIRPSFIPSVHVHTTSNWFRLDNPGKTLLDTTDAVCMSKKVGEMHRLARASFEDRDKYRSGEVYRLCRRVNQLSAMLPMQTMAADIPIENVLGGFKIFASGSTALAPHLYTWYGSPGIDTSIDSTLFLVGENFSVQGTRVIVGNLTLVPDADSKQTQVELLSRRVMRIKIPKDKAISSFTEKNAEGEDVNLVDIHVASQYGISQHLHVPLNGTGKPKNTASSTRTAKEAVADHVKSSHIPEFDWKDAPSLDAVAKFNAGGHHAFEFTDASKAKTLIIARDDSTPLPLKMSAPEMAFFMVFKSEDKDQKPLDKLSLGPYQMLENAIDAAKGEYDWRIKLNETVGLEIAKKIGELAKDKVESTYKWNEIEVQAFIRFPKDNLPILRLEKKLTVKVTREEAEPETE